MLTLEWEWAGGQSRNNAGKAVDYMMVKDETGKEVLYSEAEWEPGNDDEDEQLDIYWSCLQQLAEQAEEKGISLSDVQGLDFEHYGNPAEHFNTLKDVPIFLKEYLSKYFWGYTT
jgi:hypothetical protein